MRKRISTLFSLFVVLIGICITPISVFAETSNSSIQSDTSADRATNSSKSQTVASAEASSVSHEQEVLDTTETSGNDVQKNTEETMNSSETQQSNERQSRAPTPRKIISNIVDSVSITDADGNPLETVDQYTSIYVNIDFTLPNNEVMSGDQTIISLPDILDIERSFTFNVTNENGDVIAVASVNSETDTVTLTYTDFVETHSDVSGHLSIASVVDTTVIENNSDNTIYIDVNGDEIYGGDIHYESEGDNPDELFSKYSWFTNDDGTDLFNVLRVNPTGETYSDVTIDDILKTDGLSYVTDSFKIQVGNWKLNSENIWTFTADEDVTSQYTINFSGDHFSIHLGDIGNKEYQITYHTKVDYAPVNGETFSNYARMTDHETTIDESESSETYQTGSGEADGSNYTINVHKESESGQSLAGAEFEIIRDRTKQVTGVITTDDNGNGKVDGLLKDDYTLKETKAPDGYVLSQEEYKISPNDFGTDKSVLKTIVNQKKEITPTQVLLQANKVLTGRTLQSGEFSFILKDENDQPIETVRNDGTGAINFSEISYDQAGIYSYTISEVKGNETGLTYDDHVIKVTVTVKDEGGNLVATTAYEGSQTFTNSYQPATGSVVLQANKVLTGRTLQAGEFSFVLKDENDQPIETVRNGGTGAINFSEISYDQAGTYSYTISEVKGNETGLTYDDHVIKVTVEVKDEGGNLIAATAYEGNQTFTNSYQPVKHNTPPKPTHTDGSTLPKTGEKTSIWLLVVGIILIVVVVFIAVKRRVNKI